MKRVVDASVALKWVLDEPDRNAADALLDDDLIAPALWLVEAGNALWARVRRGDLSGPEAVAMLDELRSAPVGTSPIESDMTAALDLAILLDHPVHDCLYLALALREGVQVVTAQRGDLLGSESAHLAGGEGRHLR